MYNLKLSKYKLPQYFLRLEKIKTVNFVFLSKYLTFASYIENMPFMCIQNTYEKLLHWCYVQIRLKYPKLCFSFISKIISK